jgi:hypothetical protein
VSSAARPAQILGKVADEKRVRAFAAVALGASSVPDVAARAELTDDQAARALAHLVGAGLVREGDAGLQVDLRVLAEAARASSTPRRRPTLEGATPAQAAVVRNFVAEDGRLRALPTREAKRLLVLEWVASRFDPGRRYAEKEVNGVLFGVYDDVASLRRFLVDEGILTREAGVYWRDDVAGHDASRALD